ncbi:MAG: sugar phosphate isomerase/epimerase [Candidatus Altiarchaeota archaeon]|nr:sugar phosphate isomerase/epimerase [Candidatus Altiarchaeota archaeon]
MKVGAMNNPRKNLVDEVKLIGDYGFDYFDLTIEYPEATPEKIRANMRAFKDALSSYKLHLVGHMPWFLTIIHPYDSVRSAVISECDKIFGMCQELEIEHVTIHPDFMKLKREQKELVDRTIESLKVLSKNAKKHNLTLCLENFEEEYFSVENLKQIMSSVDGLKFTLDVGHAFMKVKKVENVLNMISELKPYIYHVHMHDNGGFRDEHLPLGVGSIEFPKIIKGLKNIGYDKTITLEIHAEDREYLQISLRKLRLMWDKP